MTTKQLIAEILETEGSEYISGSALAEKAGVTRAAVWKCIKQLEDDGYDIEAVTNRGYRLGPGNDMLSAVAINRGLESYAEKYTVEVQQEVTSTNTLLKASASELPSWYVLVAGSQSQGRGRLGRSFVSPSGSGVYLSVLTRPEIPAQQATRITTAAAVAACLAIEECTDSKPSIKWVNDVFVNGRKVCGILTEAQIDIESGGMTWAIMGIGLNVYEPEGGFPEELKDIAGPIVTERKKNLRSNLAATFLKHFYELANDLSGARFAQEYKKRSFLIGRDINVLRSGTSTPAKAIDIDSECRLIVLYEDGKTEALSSGEVSVRAR